MPTPFSPPDPVLRDIYADPDLAYARFLNRILGPTFGDTPFGRTARGFQNVLFQQYLGQAEDAPNDETFLDYLYKISQPFQGTGTNVLRSFYESQPASFRGVSLGGFRPQLRYLDF